MLSEVERHSSDFLVAFWLEYNWFFIVPTSKLKKYTTNGKNMYRFIVRYNKKSKAIDKEASKFSGKWEEIVK
jgi:hypothetical protein